MDDLQEAVVLVDGEVVDDGVGDLLIGGSLVSFLFEARDKVVFDDLKRGKVVRNQVIDVFRSGRSVLNEDGDHSKDGLNQFDV